MFKRKLQTNKLLLSLAIIVGLSGGGAFAQERVWKTFAPESGEWSIVAPGVMKPDTEALKPQADKGTYSYNDATSFFAVTFRDPPKFRFVPWGPNQNAYFKKIRKYSLEGSNGGELIKDVEFTHGAFKGRDVYIKIPNDRVTGRERQIKPTFRMERLRMFFHRKRFYMIIAVVPEREINAPVIESYFNSFAAK